MKKDCQPLKTLLSTFLVLLSTLWLVGCSEPAEGTRRCQVYQCHINFIPQGKNMPLMIRECDWYDTNNSSEKEKI